MVKGLKLAPFYTVPGIDSELPTWLGAAGIFLALLLIVTEIRRIPAAKEEKTVTFVRQLVFFMLAVLGFVVLIKFIGFLSATFILSAVGMMLMERRVTFEFPGCISSCSHLSDISKAAGCVIAGWQPVWWLINHLLLPSEN